MGSVKTQMGSDECEGKTTKDNCDINANEHELKVEVMNGAKKFALTCIRKLIERK